MEIKIKKGLDISLEGSAPHPANMNSLLTVKPACVAVCPDDFPGLLPKVAVKEGDKVEAGSPLIFHKLNPEIKLVSPVSGTVKAVVRGDRRKLERVEVTPDGAVADVAVSRADGCDFVTAMQRSGLWCMMRQRPYDIIPDPAKTPRDIFVTAFDSAPLAPHLEYAVADGADDMAAAVAELRKLTPGKVYICVPAGTPLKPVAGAEWVIVSGPHPSGNPGPQIAAIAPVNKGETVWTLDIVTLRKIGQLARTDAIDAVDMITVAGPEVEHPTYLLTVAGADVRSLLNGHLPSDDKHRRIISGSVLSGINVGADGFLGYPYRQISVIREGDDADEFMGWASPAASKPSTKRSVLGHFLSRKFAPDARVNGGHRALIFSGELDAVLPMDILAEYLLKAIMARDIEKMEQLGIYEVAPEDFALPEFVDTSKHPFQQIVREGLDYLRSEVE
ncbi:MAG: Na(+)-translocating NADH-quinone reductase subunit A [Muribaculaceae bacterium]|nr:Na(+)-translocating NADH-quinone reductase subunit A [Muribaculaceae bacterium]